MVLDQLDIHMQKMNLDTDLILFTKINSKQSTDLNVKCKTIKLLGDKIEENLHDLEYCDDFSGETPMSQYMKEIIDKLDFMKIKNFCSAKDNVKRMRRQATEQEKIFAKDTPDKGMLSKIYKEILKLNNQKRNNLIKKWAKVLNRYLTKENIHILNKHMKRDFTSYVIREIQIKTTMRYYGTPTRMDKIWNTENTKCWPGCGATGTLICCQ